MVLLELCRHPLTEAQVDRVDEYAAALGESGPGLVVARDLVRKGAAAALADYQRYAKDVELDLEEPTLRGIYPEIDFESEGEADPALAARLRAMHDLPAGTLGYEYVEFYRRNGLTLPGDDPNSPAVFVAHDMCHVIGGYEPTGQGEIALGAMQLSVTDSDAHWIGFLGNLGVHEAGFLGVFDLVAEGRHHDPRRRARAGRPRHVARIAVHRRLDDRGPPRDGRRAARRGARPVRRPAARVKGRTVGAERRSEGEVRCTSTT